MSSAESKMSLAKDKFFHVLRYLSKNPNYDHSDIDKFYENSYELARLIRMHPTHFKFTKNEKEEFQSNFSQALKNVALNTTALYHTLSPDSLNEMRGYRSKIVFVKDDIFELYKNVTNNQVSTELEETIKELEGEEYNIEDYLERWTGPDGEGKDDPKDVPNLNGVPESHNWWTAEHRNLWKEKDE